MVDHEREVQRDNILHWRLLKQVEEGVPSQRCEARSPPVWEETNIYIFSVKPAENKLIIYLFTYINPLQCLNRQIRKLKSKGLPCLQHPALVCSQGSTCTLERKFGMIYICENLALKLYSFLFRTQVYLFFLSTLHHFAQQMNNPRKTYFIF